MRNIAHTPFRRISVVTLGLELAWTKYEVNPTSRKKSPAIKLQHSKNLQTNPLTTGRDTKFEIAQKLDVLSPAIFIMLLLCI